MSISRCSRYHFNKHVIKMIIEYTQLLSTCWHMLAPEKALEHMNNKLIYKKTHVNHPCNIWVRLHQNNYLYVAKLAFSLCNEWRYRYNHHKIHTCEPKLLFMLKNIPPINNTVITKSKNNPKCLLGPFPQAMPEDCKIRKNTVHTCVKAYRKYYKSKHKQHLVSWTKKRGTATKNMKQPPWW
jgi:hypothetical protein